MSIEIGYLRKKATHFRHRQIIGLAMTGFGLVVMVIAHFLVPILVLFSAESWERLETYTTWSMAAGILITLLGIVVTVHYSGKLSEFITDWTRMMEELERKIKEIED